MLCNDALINTVTQGPCKLKILKMSQKLPLICLRSWSQITKYTYLGSKSTVLQFFENGLQRGDRHDLPLIFAYPGHFMDKNYFFEFSTFNSLYLMEIGRWAFFAPNPNSPSWWKSQFYTSPWKGKIAIFTVKETLGKKFYLGKNVQRPISNINRLLKVENSEQYFFPWNGLGMQKWVEVHAGHPCANRFQKFAKLWILSPNMCTM